MPDDRGRFVSPPSMLQSFKWNRFIAAAIGGRTDDEAFRVVAREHRRMADQTLAAWESLTR